MGFLDLFTKGIESLSSSRNAFIHSAADFGFQALANSVLPMSKAQRQMNEYNSMEAEKARNFSAQQAEIDRDWQESMYEQYNSLQGQINQAKDAGVNPLFALGASQSMQTPSHSVAAPAASGSSAAPVGQISDMVSSALGFSKLKAEIDNINAQTRNQNANALLSEIDAITRGELNSANVEQAYKAIQSADVDMKFKNAQIGEVASRIHLNDASVEEKKANVALLTAKVLTENKSREVMDAQISEIASRIGLNEEQSKYYVEVCHKLKQEVLKLIEDTKVSNQEYEYLQRTLFAREGIIQDQAYISEKNRELKEHGFNLEKWLIDVTDEITQANYENIVANTEYLDSQSMIQIFSILGNYLSHGKK